MNNKLTQQLKIKLLKELKRIQEEFDYQPEELNRDELANEAIKKISRYAQYEENLQKTANAIILVGKSVDNLHDTPQIAKVSHGFHIANAALAAYNFLRIPFMYLAAYLLDQPVPFNLSNNAQWAYSSIILGLAITALAVPVAAPIIAFVLVSIGFAESVFFLGKVLYEGNKLMDENKLLDVVINEVETELQAIQDRAKQLEQSFDERVEQSSFIDVCMEVNNLKEEFKSKKLELEALYDRKFQNEQIKDQFSIQVVLLRTLGLMLASTALIGLIISLFLPPVGLGILGVVGVIGASITLASVLITVLPPLAAWIKGKFSLITTYIMDKLYPDESPQANYEIINELSLEQPSKTIHESTMDILGELATGNEIIDLRNNLLLDKGSSNNIVPISKKRAEFDLVVVQGKSASDNELEQPVAALQC